MRPVNQIIHTYLYKPLLQFYLKTEPVLPFRGFKIKVFDGIFHPKFLFSSGYFFSFIETHDLRGKTFLEIGCGSGVISMGAYRKGATVTAIDIDRKAVKNTLHNFNRNFKTLTNLKVIESDVFKNVPQQKFDYIAVNPPYYFKKINSARQYAWYCGEEGEFFENLFAGISRYMHAHTQAFMILEENCEIGRIRDIASRHDVQLEVTDERLIKWEKNFIFRLTAH